MEMIESILNDISFTDIINNLFELCEETRPHIIKRKIKVRKKYKYQKILVTNPLHDHFIFETYFSLKMLRKRIKTIKESNNE